MGKIVIYQVLTRVCCNDVQQPLPNGSIKTNGCGKMNSFTPTVLENIKSMGVTHIWFTGLPAHASSTDYSEFGIPSSHHATVKGIAGSPYAIRDYYDIDPDLAVSVRDRLEEFKQLVQRVHDAGMKFIMDFVPNHVAREYRSHMRPKGVQDLGEGDDSRIAFSPLNNFYYITGQPLSGEIDWDDYFEFPAKATGNDKFTSTPSLSDWYETVKLNYGVDYVGGTGTSFSPIPDTWIKMRDILLFWADMNVDAFRCDMAEMVPVEFWHWAVEAVKKRYPKVEFIAEIYNPGSYYSYINYGHFDYIYDKVGLYDTLRAVTEGRESATAITRCWQSTGDVGPHMLHFMENHDEQRIASDFFARDGSGGRAPMIVSALMDNCPVMIYAGQEVGESAMDVEGFSGRDGRTSIFDYWAPDTLRRLYNRGKWDNELLTSDEKELKEFYTILLNICGKEKAICKGQFFDLMYVNPMSPDFNPHNHYAFLRSDNETAILVVANFGDKPTRSGIVIPAHAFDYMGLKEKKDCIFTDLLSGQTITADLSADRPVRVQIPALSGVVLKWII
jgi:glycosidase